MATVPGPAFEAALAAAERMLLAGGGAGGDRDGDAAGSAPGGPAARLWAALDRSPGRPALWPDLVPATRDGHVTAAAGRLRTLALAWARPGSGLTADATVPPVLAEALRFLLGAAYHPATDPAGNWWHWEIGAPRALLDTAVLLRARIPADVLAGLLAAVRRFCPDADRRTSPVNGPDSPETGANRADKAMIVALSGLLAGDGDRVAAARDSLSDVRNQGANSLFRHVRHGDGLHADGSFIQHDTVAYTGSYGVVLLRRLAEILTLLHGSPWAVADPGAAVLYDAVDRTFRPWLVQGRMLDAVRGRAISRQHTRDRDAGAAAEAAIALLAGVAPADHAERWRTPLPPGCHVFPAMGRLVQRTERWTAALALSGGSVARYECGNGENLRGWYTGDGMLTVHLPDDPDHHTDDYWPTVDPYRLPGTTVDTRRRAATGRGTGPGTGAIPAAGRFTVVETEPGRAATAVLHLHGEDSTLRAVKTWRFRPDRIHATGHGITAADGRRVETIVENRNLHADRDRRFVVDGRPREPELGRPRLHPGTRWAHLAGTGGYLFPGGADLWSLRSERTGSWRALNIGIGTAGDDTAIRRIHHTLWLDHGVSPHQKSYDYVLLPGATEEETADAAADL